MTRLPAWLWVALGASALALALGLGRKRIPRAFTLAELSKSGTAQRLGLDNTPPPGAAEAMRALVDNVLAPLQELLGSRDIQITSGYRSEAVNRAVGGVSGSHHVSGESFDIKVPGMGAKELAAFITSSGLPFDQVIWYAPARGGHVHVSYTERRNNRRATLYGPASGGYRTV